MRGRRRDDESRPGSRARARVVRRLLQARGRSRAPDGSEGIVASRYHGVDRRVLPTSYELRWVRPPYRGAGEFRQRSRYRRTTRDGPFGRAAVAPTGSSLEMGGTHAALAAASASGDIARVRALDGRGVATISGVVRSREVERPDACRALRSAAPVVHRCHASPVVVPVLVGAPVIPGRRADGTACRGEARGPHIDVGAPRSSHLFRRVSTAPAPWRRAPWRRNGAASFTACPACPADSARCHLATRHRQVQVIAPHASPRRSAEVESVSLRASPCAFRPAPPPAWSTQTLHSTR